MVAKKKARARPPVIESFGLEPGAILVRHFEVVDKLGGGWEGEVYRVRELGTGIDRAAKLFFPQRNVHNRTSRFYAKKLHKLRHCPVLIQYYAQDEFMLHGQPITVMLSEYVEGEPLAAFLARQPQRRLPPFQALHLLHTLADGMAKIHQAREYHGDLHSENVLVRRRALGFDVKLLDLFHLGPSSSANIAEDVIDLVKIFYEATGGAKHYAKQPPEVKAICMGLKRSLILRKYRTAAQLRDYIENL
jgi:serine/threonine protein kinase